MLFSYTMGVGDSIYELENFGFEIEELDGDYVVSFSDDKNDVWENYIKTNLKVGFWNEYISKETNEIVFNFHSENGFERFVVKNFDDNEVLSLCEKFCNCKFESIEKMLSDNVFYNKKIFLPRAIEKFLIDAKKNTYANGDASKVESSRLGSKDYHFEKEIYENKFDYHDTYFGGEKFIGEEVVYINNSPYWAMNYNGYSVVNTLSEEAMDNALRPALMRVGEDKSVLPVRGPSEFVNGEYRYTFEQSGTFENFSGVERIFKNEILIYELRCSGGIIK